MTCSVYGLVDPRDGQLRYVGQTVRRVSVRYDQHLIRAKTRKTHRDCWIFALLSLGLKPELVVFQELKEKQILDQAETFWIAYFRAMGCQLANLTDGGKSNSGWIASPETKAKMSAAKLGKTKSQETRSKMASAQKGNVKWKKRKNWSCSDVTKEKLRAKTLGRSSIGQVYCPETGLTYKKTRSTLKTDEGFKPSWADASVGREEERQGLYVHPSGTSQPRSQS